MFSKKTFICHSRFQTKPDDRPMIVPDKPKNINPNTCTKGAVSKILYRNKVIAYSKHRAQPDKLNNELKPYKQKNERMKNAKSNVMENHDARHFIFVRRLLPASAASQKR
jgi:hypothetical protein